MANFASTSLIRSEDLMSNTEKMQQKIEVEEDDEEDGPDDW